MVQYHLESRVQDCNIEAMSSHLVLENREGLPVVRRRLGPSLYTRLCTCLYTHLYTFLYTYLYSCPYICLRHVGHVYIHAFTHRLLVAWRTVHASVRRAERGCQSRSATHTHTHAHAHMHTPHYFGTLLYTLVGPDTTSYARMSTHMLAHMSTHTCRCTRMHEHPYATPVAY